MMQNPEGPYIQLLGNQATKYHTIEGIMGPNSFKVVYVDPLGNVEIGSNTTDKTHENGTTCKHDEQCEK